jgi:hypothetical protein
MLKKVKNRNKSFKGTIVSGFGLPLLRFALIWISLAAGGGFVNFKRIAYTYTF